MALPEFIESAGFEANLETFIRELEAEDAQLGAIFRDSVAELLTATDETTRRSARVSFNNRVHASLDELSADKADGEPTK